MQKHSPLAWFSLVLVALMCVLPFLVPHHRNPLTTFYGEWLAAALGLMASTLLLRRSSWQPFRFPVVALVPIGLMVVLGIQVAAGLAVYWQQHFLVGLYLFWAALLVVLGAELRREFGLEKIVPVLAWAVLVGGLLSALIVALQITGKNLMPYIVPAKAVGYGANLMQINHLANYLGLALASLLYLVSTSRIKVGWAMLLAVALLFPLALTGQRMGWIYVVMLSVGGWLAGRKSGRWSWRILLLIPAFMALQYAIQLLAISGAPVMPSQKVIAGMQGSSIRLQFIREAWDIFLAHPWLGAGWGQFGWQDFLLAEKYPEHAGWVSHPHNIVMQLMAETGLFGLSILIAGLYFLIRGCFSASISNERWWLFAMLGVLGVHTLLEYPLWYAYFLGITAILLGLVEEKWLHIKLDLGHVMVGAVMGFGALSLGNLGTNYTQLEKWFAFYTSGRMSPALFDQMLNEISVMRRKTLLAPLVDLVIVRALPNTPELLNDKLVVNRHVMLYQPREPETYNYATLLAMSNQPQAAQRQLQLSLIRYDRYADKYAMALLKEGRPETMPLVVTILRHNREIVAQEESK